MKSTTSPASGVVVKIRATTPSFGHPSLKKGGEQEDRENK